MYRRPYLLRVWPPGISTVVAAQSKTPILPFNAGLQLALVLVPLLVPDTAKAQTETTRRCVSSCTLSCFDASMRVRVSRARACVRSHASAYIYTQLHPSSGKCDTTSTAAAIRKGAAEERGKIPRRNPGEGKVMA